MPRRGRLAAARSPLTPGRLPESRRPLRDAPDYSVKRALISDIHSNLEGLTAVLADIRAQGVEEIFCLGDIIGYGPNPRECIDLISEVCKVTILGNHDQGAMFDPEGFNAGAERAIFWTRDQLEGRHGDPAANARRWDFLGTLPRMHRDDGYLFVHGSPRNPLNEYVFPEDVHHPKKMEKLFSLVDKFCFQGHTHVPGVFTPEGQFIRPEQMDYRYQFNGGKVMVNVGSVGQPRDGDPRSCYVILEDDALTYRRVEYPLDVTVEKIHAIPELDNFLGDRLRKGM